MNVAVEKNVLKIDRPRVSVAIPTFNRLELLKRSVRSVLSQKYSNLELIISDNASTDGTQEYLNSIEDCRVKVILNAENAGMVPNWDCCLQAASGFYFLLMSDDDALIDERAIEKFVAGFSGPESERVGVVFSDVLLERIGRKSAEVTRTNKTNYEASELIIDFFSNRVSVYPCATFLRTRDLRELNGYSSFGAKLAVDACAWVSIVLKYGVGIRIPEPLAIYRIHHSLSSLSVEVWSFDFSIMKDLIEKHSTRLTRDDLGSIRKAIHGAWARVPLGYVSRKIKYDRSYGLRRVILDVIVWRGRIFSRENLRFFLNRMLGKFKVKSDC